MNLFDDASEHLLQAIEFSSENLLAHRLLAECYLKMRQPKVTLKRIKCMTFSINQKSLWVTIFLTLTTLGACSSVTILPAESWKLPARENAESAMIVGRIGLEGHKSLAINAVTFQLWGKIYFHGGDVPRGEDEFLMDNGYFVIPNIKPGSYWFTGFYADGRFNRLSADKKDFIEIKPGEIKFVGSFDYSSSTASSISTAFGVPGSFSFKPSRKPSELEMMRWLLRAGNGSGWEPTIKQRIKALGGSKN